MTYKTAFPDFILDVEIPSGFRDDSYRNDAMPQCRDSPVNYPTVRR